MKIHPLIAGAAISALLAAHAWTLKTVMDLQVHMATVEQKLEDLKPKYVNEHRYDPNSVTLHP